MGGWLQRDVESRLAAAAAAPSRGTCLADTFHVLQGEVPDFFRRLVAVIPAALSGNRRALAQALLQLETIPTWLQELSTHRSSKGASWLDFTRRWNVLNCVHAGGDAEPWWDLGIYQGWTWQPMEARKFHVALIRLVMDACESMLRNESAGSRTACLQAIAAHFNHAAREAQQTTRILMSPEGVRPWKLDVDPGKVAWKYGGANKRKRLTSTQARTGIAAGRFDRGG